MSQYVGLALAAYGAIKQGSDARDAARYNAQAMTAQANAVNANSCTGPQS